MLLYGYGLVCMSMLAFNIVYLFGLKKKNTRLEKSQDRFAAKVNCQLERIQTASRWKTGTCPTSGGVSPMWGI